MSSEPEITDKRVSTRELLPGDTVLCCKQDGCLRGMGLVIARDVLDVDDFPTCAVMWSGNMTIETNIAIQMWVVSRASDVAQEYSGDAMGGVQPSDACHKMG